jgi:hypothetical protein
MRVLCASLMAATLLVAAPAAAQETTQALRQEIASCGASSTL